MKLVRRLSGGFPVKKQMSRMEQAGMCEGNSTWCFRRSLVSTEADAVVVFIPNVST